MSKIRALLIGINTYPVAVGPLSGCVNDMRNLSVLLNAQHGTNLVVRTLLDKRATFNEIAAGWQWLAGEAPGVAIVAYSGHGTRIPDENKDETESAFDQAIVPVSGALITDDRNGYWASLLPRETLLIQHYDCCYATKGERLIGTAFRNRSADYTRIGCMQKARTKWAGPVPLYVAHPRHIFIATSQDNFTAADAVIDGQAQGAGTWAILRALQGEPGLRNLMLAQRANDLLERQRFAQRVNVWSAQPTDMERVVFQ